MAKAAGRAVERLLSFLGGKKPRAQPCIEYEGNSDGWLPVYLDGVQVMFHDSDQSTPMLLWKADKIELERIKSDIAEREGIHIRQSASRAQRCLAFHEGTTRPRSKIALAQS